MVWYRTGESRSLNPWWYSWFPKYILSFFRLMLCWKSSKFTTVKGTTCLIKVQYVNIKESMSGYIVVLHCFIKRRPCYFRKSHVNLCPLNMAFYATCQHLKNDEITNVMMLIELWWIINKLRVHKWFTIIENPSYLVARKPCKDLLVISTNIAWWTHLGATFPAGFRKLWCWVWHHRHFGNWILWK